MMAGGKEDTTSVLARTKMLCLRSSYLRLDREASLLAANGAPSESQEWFRSVSEIFGNNRRLVCYPDLARNKNYSIYCLKSNQRRVFVAVNTDTSQAVILVDQNIQGNEHHLLNHAQLIKEGLDRVQLLYDLSTRLLFTSRSASEAASTTQNQSVDTSVKQPINHLADSLANGITPESIVNTFKRLDSARRGSDPYDTIFASIARIVSYPRVSLWFTRSSKKLFLNYQLDKRPTALEEITDFKLKDYLFNLFEGIKGQFNTHNLNRYIVFLLSSYQAHPEFIREEILSTDLTQVVWSRDVIDQLVRHCQDPICFPILQAILDRFQLWSHLSATAGQMLLELPVDKEIRHLLPFMTVNSARKVLERYQGPLIPILEQLKGKFFCEKLEVCSKKNDNAPLMLFLENEYREFSDAERQCYQLSLDRLRIQLLNTPFESHLTALDESPPPSFAATIPVTTTVCRVAVSEENLVAPFMAIQKGLLNTTESISRKERAVRRALQEIHEILKKSYLLSEELNGRLEKLITRTFKMPTSTANNFFSLDATLFSIAIDYGDLSLLVEMVKYFHRQGKRDLLEKHYGSALFNATQSANVIAAEFCLSLGFSPNRIDPASGITPLYLACVNLKNQPNAKVLALVKILIQSGASIDQQTVFGDTALSVSVVRKHTEVMKELLAHGADPNLPLGGGYFCLDIAATIEHRDMIAVLLAHGAKVGKGPARMVFKIGHQEVILQPSSYLLQARERFAKNFLNICQYGNRNGKLADLRAKASLPPNFFSFHCPLMGIPALHHALFSNQSNVLHELVEVDHLSLDALGHFPDDTPGLQKIRTILPKPFAVLHLAIILGNVDETLYLLNKGAFVDIEDGRGWTPLFFAAHLKNDTLFNLLLSRGANPHHRAENKVTLLDIHPSSPCKNPQ